MQQKGDLMIIHIVMFKFLDQAEGRNKQENAEIVRNILLALPSKICQIRRYDVGDNLSNSPNAYDLVLYSAFDDIQKLNCYREHPTHIEALDFIKKVISDSVVVDYEYK